ncbi:MAG: hypothetical protein HFI67_01540 [Lachnospiraceae bacterium]|jgi:hypothetical protein|nr:hypothetical protein [Lachnospiraceae bacterium]
MKKFKQILCILGALLLAGIYVCTLIFSITDQTQAKSWLNASLYASVAVPVFLYAFFLITKLLDRRKKKED